MSGRVQAAHSSLLAALARPCTVQPGRAGSLLVAAASSSTLHQERKQASWAGTEQAAAACSCCWLDRAVGLTSSVSKRNEELQQLITEDLPRQICLQRGKLPQESASQAGDGAPRLVPHFQPHLQSGFLLLSLVGQLQLTPSRQPALLMWQTCHAVLAPAAVKVLCCCDPCKAQ